LFPVEKAGGRLYVVAANEWPALLVFLCKISTKVFMNISGINLDPNERQKNEKEKV
jgi:hypothetical protein